MAGPEGQQDMRRGLGGGTECEGEGMSIKPIETAYKGYRFRSRLEARWAVFFDAVGLDWEYEKEGFDIDGSWYLPDFYIPKRKYWIEIKGEPRNEDIVKIIGLALYKREISALITGLSLTDFLVAIPFGGDYGFPLLCNNGIAKLVGSKLKIFEQTDGEFININNNGIIYDDLEKGKSEFIKSKYRFAILEDNGSQIFIDKVGYILQRGSWACPDDNKNPFIMGVNICWYIPQYVEKGCIGETSEYLKIALTKAKQARFEHGEKG